MSIKSKDPLREYHRKRDFGKSTEPRGRERPAGKKGGARTAAKDKGEPTHTGEDAANDKGERTHTGEDTRTVENVAEAKGAARDTLLYVMQKHDASHLHYDLRLEQDGVLRSWALPKGPPLKTGERRLAIEVEDHPMEYGSFEGTIPEGEYGGGTVMLWDEGTWQVRGKNDRDHIDLTLNGKKLKGSWTLVRTDMNGKDSGRNWLMIKRSDAQKTLTPNDRSVSTGRTMGEIAAGKKAAGSSVTVPRAEDVVGALPGTSPEKFVPQLATLVDKAPDGEEWVHEIKFDGYRMVARKQGSQVRFFSRNGHDWTDRFAEQARVLARVPAENALIDGEMVAMRPDGSTSFRHLQEALSKAETGSLIFQVFDLPYFEGYDLKKTPLFERKKVLNQLLDGAGFEKEGLVRFSDHIVGSGPAFHEQVCSLGLEGIVSKRRTARYVNGRSKQWLKVKCTLHEEFVVGGFTAPSGARTGFGSLLLGVFEGNRFTYRGRVGTGFSSLQLRQLYEAMQELLVDSSPFDGEVPKLRGVRWIRPEMVVEVEFTERTRDGRLRHPTFRGVREDKEAREVHETNTGATAMATNDHDDGVSRVCGVPLTHPERVMYPEQGLTKLDLARYYEDIQDWVLPYLANRPLSLVRCPQGQHKECFYQKHLSDSQAKNVPRFAFHEKEGTKEYAYVQSAAHLVALVQAGVLELHPFGSQVEDVEHPDMMIFDLDPSPGITLTELVRITRELRDRIRHLGLEPFLRSTGGKGFHIVVPLEPRADWDEVKEFAHAVADMHARDEPSRLTTNMSKAKRGGRVFIDYLRNGRGATAIGSYSARARPGAPVATPLRWDELSPGMSPDRYGVGNVRRRLGALKSDPWDGFYAARAPISASMRKAVGL